MMPANTKGSEAICIAFPDVCKTPTPVGPIPIPYPNIAQTAQAKQQSNKVKVGGKSVFTKSSNFKTSRGDQPGTIRGVMSNKVMGETSALKARLNAVNVKLQGLSPQQPRLWQAALEEYAVTASALYVTLNPD
jgi:hypothetical protein